MAFRFSQSVYDIIGLRVLPYFMAVTHIVMVRTVQETLVARHQSVLLPNNGLTGLPSLIAFKSQIIWGWQALQSVQVDWLVYKLTTLALKNGQTVFWEKCHSCRGASATTRDMLASLLSSIYKHLWPIVCRIHLLVKAINTLRAVIICTATKDKSHHKYFVGLVKQ